MSEPIAFVAHNPRKTRWWVQVPSEAWEFEVSGRSGKEQAANWLAAALNATETGRELVVLVVRLIETNGSDYSAWQGIKRWLESNPIPEPSAG